MLATHRTQRLTTLLLACACLAALVSGAAHADTSFFRALLKKDTATFADACRIMAMLHTKSRDAADFKDDLRLLRKAGVVPVKLMKPKDGSVTVGELSFMLCKTLGIKGGLTMRVFGVSKRYAYRECVYLGLVPNVSPRRYISGEELVGIAGLAEEYMRAESN